MLLVTEFTNERGEAFTVLQLIKRLRSAIIQIDGILFEHQGRIEELEIDVEKLKDDVENIYAELLIINNRLDNIDIRLDGIDDRLQIIDTKIFNIENTINDIEIKITAIEENIDSIENNIDNIEISIVDINKTINNITELIAGATADITDINNKIDALQIQLDKIPIVQPSLLNGYIKIDGNDTLVYQDDGSGTGSETFRSNKRLLAYKQFGDNDYGVYKNVFNYLIGDEITKTMDNNILRYNFKYTCNYGIKDNIPTGANFQVVIGGTQLNFGELVLSKDANNRNFNLECEIMINENESGDYNVRGLLRFYTADPVLWESDTLIKTLYSSETGIVIVPQDTLKFNVMLRNGYLNVGWYQTNPSISPSHSGSWYGVLETDLITNIIGSD